MNKVNIVFSKYLTINRGQYTLDLYALTIYGAIECQLTKVPLLYVVYFIYKHSRQIP